MTATMTDTTPHHRRSHAPPPPEVAAARAMGLRYVTDRQPGIRRRRHGATFRYTMPDGTPLRDRETKRRIAALAIPPAWTDVWICPLANGHLQATGRDAKGRKQYRYHPHWRAMRDATKYTRMIAFGRALPRIRDRVNADLARPGLPREKVLATVVRLLETTLIRIGNAEYAKTNRSYGLTTLRNRHVEIAGTTVRFHFRGKSGVEHTVGVCDRRLAGIVRRCKELPGAELFQYLDDEGARQSIDSGDVNAYLRAITGEDFSAKDFRTWAGTVLAAMALQEFAAFDSEAQAKQNVVRAIERVAARLGNTPSVCRKCYVHPAVLDAYMDGALLATLKQRAEQTIADSLDGLEPEEAAVLALLQQRLARAAAPQYISR